MNGTSVPTRVEINLRTIWVALAIGCATYVLVARMLRPAAVPAAIMLPDPTDPLELAVAIAAIGAIAFGVIVSRVMMKAARERLRAAPGSENEVERAAVLPLIVRYAMFESASVLGFALVLLGKPAAKVVPFVALSLIALILNFPSRDRIARELSSPN